jgi:hypothetical protein
MAKTELPAPAFLSNGDMIEVPGDAVADWMYQVSNGDTKLGLAEWYIAQGENHEVENGAVVLGKHVVPTPTTAQNYPLTIDQAKPLMDDLGRATFVVHIDKTEYLLAIENQDDDFVIGDFVHEKVLGFGLAHDYATNVVAVDGDNFVIEYTTSVIEAIAMDTD